MSGDRTLLVDASVVITLAEVGEAELLAAPDGELVVPAAVAEEVIEEPAAGWLESASDTGLLSVLDPISSEECAEAAAHLGADVPDDPPGSGWPTGDVALLAHGLAEDEPVVVTDDRPLRDACKALGIDLSGSIGVLVVAVEHGEIDADEARRALYGMDEVGARLSATLIRRAERMIERAERE